MAGKEIVDEISRANEIVSAKATPEEAEAFRAWIMECAQRAADAAKGRAVSWASAPSA